MVFLIMLILNLFCVDNFCLQNVLLNVKNCIHILELFAGSKTFIFTSRFKNIVWFLFSIQPRTT